MSLAESHDWTPEEVGRMDPDFIDELFIQKQARNDHELFMDTDPKKQEARRKKMITQRKIELMNQREQRGSK